FGFGDLFGRRRGGPRRGSDLRYNLEISFEEAAFGTETHIQIPRAETCKECGGNGAAPGTQPTACPTCGGSGQMTFQQGFFSVARTCSRCRGTGRVVASECKTCHGEGQVAIERKLQIKIPPGVDTGSQLRITGEGEAGGLGGPPGDLYVVIRVEADQRGPRRAGRPPGRAHPRRRQDQDLGSGGRAARDHPPRPRPGLPPARQQAPRRSPRAPARGHPHPAQLRAEAPVRAAREDAARPRHQGQGQDALRPHEGHPGLRGRP
ncbi:MAG: hypothetical protein DMF79_06520, partial [Acidobacteria bacterium]